MKKLLKRIFIKKAKSRLNSKSNKRYVPINYFGETIGFLILSK